MELTLIDVPTSQVLYSGVVTGVSEDTLESSEFALLSRMHFVYYPDDMLASPNSTSPSAEESFLTGHGFAIGSMTFTFTEGIQAADAYIRDAATNTQITKIEIPGDNPGSTYSYTWNLTDTHGQRIKTGDYVLWLGGRQVRQFHIGN